MPARLIIAAVVAWMVMSTAFAQAPAQPKRRIWTLVYGVVDATDQASQECYFSIGKGAMLVLDPKGVPCMVVRAELMKKNIQLIAVVEEVDRAPQ